ncbi:MAG: hypothetical protein PW999_21340 [Paraburkholderia tropica]|nr:hypothetical protein [Paraburkholderia tropica]
MIRRVFEEVTASDIASELSTSDNVDLKYLEFEIVILKKGLEACSRKCREYEQSFNETLDKLKNGDKIINQLTLRVKHFLSTADPKLKPIPNILISKFGDDESKLRSECSMVSAEVSNCTLMLLKLRNIKPQVDELRKKYDQAEQRFSFAKDDVAKLKSELREVTIKLHLQKQKILGGTSEISGQLKANAARLEYIRGLQRMAQTSKLKSKNAAMWAGAQTLAVSGMELKTKVGGENNPFLYLLGDEGRDYET